MYQEKSTNNAILQTKCWIASEGHLWMRGHFDALPAPVRQRLRQSPFNLCAACLMTDFLPKAQKRGISRERALFAAIEIMEAQARQAPRGKNNRE